MSVTQVQCGSTMVEATAKIRRRTVTGTGLTLLGGRANAPQSLFDTVARLIQKNFDPNSNSAPPTRLTMLSWIEKQVHPEELQHLSLPHTTPINDCPSGRSVSITHFEMSYWPRRKNK